MTGLPRYFAGHAAIVMHYADETDSRRCQTGRNLRQFMGLATQSCLVDMHQYGGKWRAVTLWDERAGDWCCIAELTAVWRCAANVAAISGGSKRYYFMVDIFRHYLPLDADGVFSSPSCASTIRSIVL